MHYWTAGPMPPEALDAELCARYHCPPDVLDRQDPIRVLQHMTVWSVQHEVEQARTHR